MRSDAPGRAPNYTTACIAMFGVNLAWILLLIFALWGLIAALLAGFAVHRWIGWLEVKRSTSNVASPDEPRA